MRWASKWYRSAWFAVLPLASSTFSQSARCSTRGLPNAANLPSISPNRTSRTWIDGASVCAHLINDASGVSPLETVAIRSVSRRPIARVCFSLVNPGNLHRRRFQ